MISCNDQDPHMIHMLIMNVDHCRWGAQCAMINMWAMAISSYHIGVQQWPTCATINLNMQ